MDSERFMRSVRRCVIDELETLVAAPHPTRMWHHALQALLRIAGAPHSDRRARLCFVGAAAGEPRWDDDALLRFATGLELQHLFVLVLDDAMDHAQRRRGQPTLHGALRSLVAPEEAERFAFLCACITDAQASRLMAAADPTGAAFARVLQAKSAAGVAQVRDLVPLESDSFADTAAFVRFLYDKGGDHGVAAPLVAGALIAGADAEAIAALERWAFHVGIAHQALDDLADFVSSPIETGKDGYQDLSNRRPSLITWLLAEAVGPAVADRLLREQMMPAHRRRLARLIDEHGVLGRARALIASQLEVARTLDGLPDRCREGLDAITAHLLRTLSLEGARPSVNAPHFPTVDAR